MALDICLSYLCFPGLQVYTTMQFVCCRGWNPGLHALCQLNYLSSPLFYQLHHRVTNCVINLAVTRISALGGLEVPPTSSFLIRHFGPLQLLSFYGGETYQLPQRCLAYKRQIGTHAGWPC